MLILNSKRVYKQAKNGRDEGEIGTIKEQDFSGEKEVKGRAAGGRREEWGGRK